MDTDSGQGSVEANVDSAYRLLQDVILEVQRQTQRVNVLNERISRLEDMHRPPETETVAGETP